MKYANNPGAHAPHPLLSAAVQLLQPIYPNITVDGLKSLMERWKEPPEDALFTRQESADRARLSLSTLDRLIKGGDLKVVRIRHSIRIRKSALDALLQGSKNADFGTPGIAIPSIASLPTLTSRT